MNDGTVESSQPFHMLQRRKKIGPDGEIDPAWDVCHVEFHNELVAQCRMPKLLALRDIFEAQARRYRRIAVYHLRAPRDDVGEHRAIMEAVLDRCPAAATNLLANHYMTTVEIILETAYRVRPFQNRSLRERPYPSSTDKVCIISLSVR